MNNKAILITGGTGSFGRSFVDIVLKKYSEIKRLVIFSRDGLKQSEMSLKYPSSTYPAIQFVIGDVRDERRLKRACEGIDIIVHAAALKQVPSAECNPMEFIKTNILGAENVINAALDTQVREVIALSTDKAAAPISLYGATKLCADKLFIDANNIIGDRDLKFSVIRYGNVLGSSGSVIPYFLEKRKDGVLPITDSRMTRFSISPNEGVDLALYAINKAKGGEIFVPKIPSYRITDVAKAIAPEAELKEIGTRPGEKIHEEMISSYDAQTTLNIGKYYVILPIGSSLRQEYLKQKNCKPVSSDFSYNSETNEEWLAVKEIKSLIQKHIDPQFVS